MYFVYIASVELLKILIGIFLTRPGDGQEYVYSPVEVNATLHCVVNDTVLVWGINGTYHTSVAPSKGIFVRLPRRLDGRAESFLLVTGYINENNNTRICCRTLMVQPESCTTLIIYGI